MGGEREKNHLKILIIILKENYLKVEKLLVKNNIFLKKKKKIFKYKFPILARNTIITQEMLKNNYLVHNGKNYIIVSPTTARLGTKIGCYSFTKKICFHKIKKKKKKK